MIRNTALTLIGLAFVAASVFLIWSGKVPADEPDAWIGLLFFGGCAAVGLVDLLQGFARPAPAAGDEQLVLHFNRVRSLVLGLASAAWLAAGVLGLSGTVFPLLLSWALILFAGLGAIVLLGIALDGRAKVVVDREGLADYQTINAKIPWADVRSVEIADTYGVPYVGVRLKDPKAYSAKRTWRARLFRRDVETLQLTDVTLNGSLVEIADAIARFAPPGTLAEADD